MSRRFLQIVLGVLSIIPVLSGITGMFLGIGKFFDTVPRTIELITYASMDSQNRYLSAIWLGYAVIVWWIIPTIERHMHLFRIMMACIFLGGLARLYSFFVIGTPKSLYFILIGLELLVPLILIPWQTYVARQCFAKNE
ncbi:MAG: DUF4345 domain-containing protein [bacterium]